MTKASIDLQDLRRRLYVKAKAETSWRFWGLYVHVCKMDTLRAAYALAQKNDGAPGVDGMTFAAIEAKGVEAFLVQIRDELVGRTYVPLPARRQEIPKDGGKVRVLSIPAIRDRVVQGIVAALESGPSGHRLTGAASPILHALPRGSVARGYQRACPKSLEARSHRFDPANFRKKGSMSAPGQNAKNSQ